jgi:hypothetical protein
MSGRTHHDGASTYSVFFYFFHSPKKITDILSFNYIANLVMYFMTTNENLTKMDAKELIMTSIPLFVQEMGG